MEGITLNWDCVTCGLFGQLDALSMRYGRETFEALLPGAREAFGSFIGIWFAYQLVYKGIFRGELSFQLLLPRLALFFALQACLWSADLYWDYVYLPLKATTSALSQAVVAPAGADFIQDRSFNGLLQTVETQVRKVIELAWALTKDAGITSLHLALGGLVLIIPYLFVWCIFLAFLLEGVFKLLAITALAPLAIIAAGFGPTRSFTVSAVRVLLGGALTVVFASVAMGFTVAVLRYYTEPGIIPRNADGTFAMGAGAFVFSAQYLALFILGFISILFHLKAATLAANISGALDSPGAAAAVIGAGWSLVAAAKSGGLSMLGRAAKMATGESRDSNGSNRQRLLDRFERRYGSGRRHVSDGGN